MDSAFTVTEQLPCQCLLQWNDSHPGPLPPVLTHGTLSVDYSHTTCDVKTLPEFFPFERSMMSALWLWNWNQRSERILLYLLCILWFVYSGRKFLCLAVSRSSIEQGSSLQS